MNNKIIARYTIDVGDGETIALEGDQVKVETIVGQIQQFHSLLDEVETVLNIIQDLDLWPDEAEALDQLEAIIENAEKFRLIPKDKMSDGK